MIAAYWGCVALKRRHLPQIKFEMYQCAARRGDAWVVCGKLCQAKVHLNDFIKLNATELLLSKSNFTKLNKKIIKYVFDLSSFGGVCEERCFPSLASGIEQADQTVTLWICIRKVLGSNLYGHRLSWLRVFVVFFSPSRKFQDSTKHRPRSFPAKSFGILFHNFRHYIYILWHMGRFYNHRGMSLLLGNDSVNIHAATNADNNSEYIVIIRY
jgi:hypothetical protein